MAQNEKQWSSATPGLLIILLDQSGSMITDYEGSTRTEFATLAVNKVIDTLISKNFDGEKPKNRCFITVIGYDSRVNELCSGWLDELDAKPLRIETLKKKIPDGAGGILEMEVKQPIWVEAVRQGGVTNMLGAFQLAKDLSEKWIKDAPDRPAPVIINISDGVPYYNGKEPHICMQETTALVQEIKQISNADGPVLIFNAQIDTTNGKVVFPTNRDTVTQEEAKFLFDISSEIPQSYTTAAQKSGLPMQSGSRGCIFGAEGVELIQLIDFGSSKGQGGDKGLM